MAGTSSSNRNFRSVVVEPVREPLQPRELLLVHRGVAVGVVADEHLGEVGVELLDVGGEVVAVLEVELVLAGLLDRHRQLEAVLARLLGDVRAELLVDEHAGGARLRALVDGFEHALEDQVLGVGDLLRLLGSRVALDPEHLLLERPPMVEREDVQLAVVSESHLRSPFVPLLAAVVQSTATAHVAEAASLRRDGAQVPGPGPSYTIGIEEELMILDAESLELVNAIESLLEPRPGGRDQARADGVRARGLDRPVREHRRGRRAAARAAGAGSRDRGAQEPDDRLGGNPSVRDVGGPADRRAAALPRPRVRAAIRRPPGADLRDARARRRSTIPRRRFTSPTGCACTCRSCSGCRPTPRSGVPRPRGWRRPGRRSSGRSRGWASRRRTRTGRTTSSGSSS